MTKIKLTENLDDIASYFGAGYCSESERDEAMSRLFAGKVFDAIIGPTPNRPENAKIEWPGNSGSVEVPPHLFEIVPEEDKRDLDPAIGTRELRRVTHKENMAVDAGKMIGWEVIEFGRGSWAGQDWGHTGWTRVGFARLKEDALEQMERLGAEDEDSTEPPLSSVYDADLDDPLGLFGPSRY